MSTWIEQAACKAATYPDDWFTDPTSHEGQQALAICKTCPVTVECLTYANEAGHRDGIWGGLTAQQRARQR